MGAGKHMRTVISTQIFCERKNSFSKNVKSVTNESAKKIWIIWIGVGNNYIDRYQ